MNKRVFSILLFTGTFLTALLAIKSSVAKSEKRGVNLSENQKAPEYFEFYRGLEPLFVPLNTQVKSGEVLIRLIGIKEDGRCPRGVDCAANGEVGLEIELTKDAQKTIVNFALRGKSYFGKYTFKNPWTFLPMPPDSKNKKEWEGYKIHLVDVNPYPEYPTANKKNTDYVATFFVRAFSSK